MEQGLGFAVNGPLTPDLSLREREQKQIAYSCDIFVRPLSLRKRELRADRLYL